MAVLASVTPAPSDNQTGSHARSLGRAFVSHELSCHATRSPSGSRIRSHRRGRPQLRADADGRRPPGRGWRRRLNRRSVAQLLAATTETAQFLRAAASFPLRASAGAAADILEALAVEGRPLEPLRLLALADFPRFGRRIARRASAACAGVVSAARSRDRRAAVVQARDRAGPRQDRSVGRRASTTRARS